MDSSCLPRADLKAATLPARWLATACVAGAAIACTPSFGAEDLPPPIDTLTPDKAAPPSPAPAKAGEQPASADGATAASAAEPAPVRPERDVRIEQKHVGRRVSEVIVTPAGFTYHYTMTHLDDQDPGTLMQPHPELSVPSFFRFDFNF
jgi:hypothetical protein